MSETIVLSLLSLFGTIVGTFGGIVTASKLTVYRIEQLEKKVEKHNNMVERTFKLEGRMNNAENDIDDIKKRGK